MDANLKRILLNMTYYTLIGGMVAFEIFFMVSLANATLSTWERVLYFILAGALVGVVIYDVICTCMHRQKYIAGFILYSLTVLSVALGLVVMAVNSTSGRLLISINETFFRLILISFIINTLAVVIYCTGEKLISTIANRNKK